MTFAVGTASLGLLEIGLLEIGSLALAAGALPALVHMWRQEKAGGGISWTTLLLVAGAVSRRRPGSSRSGTWHPESAPAGAPGSRGRSTLEATAGNQP
ncbi:hypothetical protein [Streptomyces massasporeus]|uniref:hypothetical protein n=1 Tax=Streptomyces massasporeus TaxID=67324 RepID=UPI0036C15ADE